MRLGPILIRAGTRRALDEVHARVRTALRVTVSTSDGPRGPIWD